MIRYDGSDRDFITPEDDYDSPLFFPAVSSAEAIERADRLFRRLETVGRPQGDSKREGEHAVAWIVVLVVACAAATVCLGIYL